MAQKESELTHAAASTKLMESISKFKDQTIQNYLTKLSTAEEDVKQKMLLLEQRETSELNKKND